MTNMANAARRAIPWRLIGWGGAAFLLLLPLITGAPWTASDYVVMGILFGIAGLVIEGGVRASRGDPFYRAGAFMTVVTVFLLIWVNLAVGFLGDEDNLNNLLFLGVIGLVILGGLATRFRARGMARTLFAAALLQIAIGIAALLFPLGASGYQGVYEAVLGTGMFTFLWLLSAGLFHRAAGKDREQAA